MRAAPVSWATGFRRAATERKTGPPMRPTRCKAGADHKRLRLEVVAAPTGCRRERKERDQLEEATAPDGARRSAPRLRRPRGRRLRAEGEDRARGEVTAKTTMTVRALTGFSRE